MAKLVTYLNALEPLERITKEIECKNSNELKELLKIDETIYDIIFSRNTAVITEEYFEISEEDFINVLVVPRGGGAKKILNIVATLALTIAAPALGAGLSGILGLGSKIIGTMIVMGVGSFLINTVLPPVTPDITNSSEYDNSQTYSWTTGTNLYKQNSALPKLFGKMKIQPPVISSYIETTNNKQYLNALFALTDGTVNTIEDIRINDNPIENYDEVTYEIRTGDNNQETLSGFDGTKFDKNIGYLLESDADYDYSITENNIVNNITVGLYFPSGIYKTNDDAQLTNGVWQFYISIEGQDGLSFNYVDSFQVDAKSLSPYRFTKSYSLPKGKFIVGLKAIHTVYNSKYHDEVQTVYWEYMQETIPYDFTYPNTALLAVRALATDQLSGSFPNVTCICDNGINNPADICLEILDECGVDNSLIDTAKFDEWRDFCNENQYFCNVYLDQITNVRKTLDIISQCGRARVEQFGSRYIVIADMPNATPVQAFMFTMGNIVKDSFKQTFLPIADRANVIEITFNDSNNNYERTTLEVSSENYDSEFEENRVSIDLIGCTDRDMAIKHGKYLLNCNRYITDSVEFQADNDSLVCRYGDVIQVSHDVPAWGTSGRILNANTSHVIIDNEISMTYDSYFIRIKSNVDNQIIEKQLVYNELPSNILEFSTPLEIDSEDIINGVYSFGEVNKISKYFRVNGISTNGNELRRTIKAVEYNDDVYSDSHYIEPIDNSNYDISNIKIKDYTLFKDGTYYSYLDIKWTGASIYYIITYIDPNNIKKSVKVYNNSFTIHDAQSGLYTITITDSFGSSLTTTYNIESFETKPLPDIQNLTSNYNNFAGGITVLYWDKVTDIRSNIDYEIRMGNSWDSGLLISRTIENKYNVTNNGNYWISAHYSFNDLNIYSTNPKNITVTTASLSQNIVKTWDEAATDWTGTLTEGLIINEIQNNLTFANTANISTGYYELPETHIIDVGRITPCNVIANYQVYGTNNTTDILSMENILGVADILGSTLGKYVYIVPEIATAGEDEIFGEYQAYIPGYYNARYFKTRIKLTTLDTSVNLVLSNFTFSVDVPDKIDVKNITTLNTGALTVTYDTPFNGSDAIDNIPRVHATITNQQSGDYIVISNESITGFDIAVKNGSSFVIRNVNTITKGY